MRHDHAIIFEKLDDADKEMLGKWYHSYVQYYTLLWDSIYTLYAKFCINLNDSSRIACAHNVQ